MPTSQAHGLGTHNWCLFISLVGYTSRHVLFGHPDLVGPFHITNLALLVHFHLLNNLCNHAKMLCNFEVPCYSTMTLKHFKYIGVGTGRGQGAQAPPPPQYFGMSFFQNQLITSTVNNSNFFFWSQNRPTHAPPPNAIQLPTPMKYRFTFSVSTFYSSTIAPFTFIPLSHFPFSPLAFYLMHISKRSFSSMPISVAHTWTQVWVPCGSRWSTCVVIWLWVSSLEVCSS